VLFDGGQVEIPISKKSITVELEGKTKNIGLIIFGFILMLGGIFAALVGQGHFLLAVIMGFAGIFIANHGRFQKKEESKPAVSGLTIVLFIGNVLLGFIVLVLIWIQSFGEFSTSGFVLMVLPWEIGGTFVTAAVTSAIQPRSDLSWSTGFALPILFVGCFYAIGALLQASLGLLCVTLFGFAMFGVSLLGARLGRRLRRRTT
jgi:hypothetical protein